MPTSHLISSGLPNASPSGPHLFPFRGLLEHLLPLERVRELYRRAQQPVNRSLMENVLSEMEVEYKIADADLARVPAEGPVLVTANHPFGILDGAILGALLQRVRPDVKIVTNHLLAGIPELHEHCIFVDPFGKPESIARNRVALRKAIRWLENGGMLAMFPAGEVSHVQLRHMEVSDSEWNPIVSRLIVKAGVPALPLFFRGSNSIPFQAMGLVHPRLRTAWLFHEFLHQRGRRVEVRVGNTISAETIRHARSPRAAAAYLRWRTYLLAKRGAWHWQVPAAFKAGFPLRRQEAIAATVPAPRVLKDLEQLPENQRLATNREFTVYIADDQQVPNVIDEIGRLREVTFRAAGEGTGQRRDLDRYDDYYKHLLLWSNANQEIVGGYRLGLTREILPSRGIGGLYTNTLFRYDGRLFDCLEPALELGRSFIRPEYQRQYAPLLMLWKGIGRFLMQHKEVAILFGAVSISSRYTRISRELIVRFFESIEDREQISSFVFPRRPFHVHSRASAGCANVTDLQDLPISDLEVDGKGIPILIKHYAKLGGRIVSFNVDRNFSDVLDGLVFVDLRRTNPTVLERYMGKSEAREFLAYHRQQSAVQPDTAMISEPALSREDLLV